MIVYPDGSMPDLDPRPKDILWIRNLIANEPMQTEFEDDGVFAG